MGIPLKITHKHQLVHNAVAWFLTETRSETTINPSSPTASSFPNTVQSAGVVL